MRIEKLTTIGQFKRLQKGDMLIVEWKDGSMEVHNGTRITANNIVSIKNSPPIGYGDIYTEIILNKNTNSYFCVEMYLRGESYVKEVYQIIRN